MKKLLVMATAIVLVASVAQAQPARPATAATKAAPAATAQQGRKLTPQEVQQRFANMTPEQKAKMSEQMKARYSSMSAEERAQEKARLEKVIETAKSRKDDATVQRFQERLDILNSAATTTAPAVAKTAPVRATPAVPASAKKTK